MNDLIETTTMRKVYWRLVPLLFALMFFNYLDRINIGFAALDMNEDLAFSPAVFGFAGSIFFLGYMLFQIPSNLVLFRVGARRWIATIVFVWGAVAASTAFVTNDTTLYVLRFTLGFVEAGFLPGVAVYLTSWFPIRHRAGAVAGYIIAGKCAAVLGGPVSTAIMVHADGALGMSGWQWMFLIQGVPATILGLITLRCMTERPADASWLSSEQKEWLESALARERASLGEWKSPSLWRVAADGRVWNLACLFGCALVGIYGLFLWLPQILKSLGNLTTMEVGLLSALPPLMGIIGTILISRHSDRTGERKFHLACVYGLSALAIAGSAYASNPIAAYVCLCVAGLFIYAGTPLFWTLASSFRTGVAGAATIALVNTIAQFGGLVGPWSIGLLRTMTGNFQLALLAIAGFLLLAAVLALRMRVTPLQSDTGLPPTGIGASVPSTPNKSLGL